MVALTSAVANRPAAAKLFEAIFRPPLRQRAAAE
jgi:hypothetical protein